MRNRLICSSFLILLTALTLSPAAKGQGGGDVRRRTIAITYYKDPIEIPFAGTTLRPTAKAEATVERWRKRNESEIDIKIENMIPAYNYGADYTTYVLWAITPAGQVDNLGEFRLSGSSARLKAATPHQTFAMIITAEPHFLVKLPSSQVILENVAPNTDKVSIQSSNIYFTGDSGQYYKDTTLPQIVGRDYNKIPMELLQARRAIQIARLADGERYDPEDFTKAASLLNQAEAAYRGGEHVHEVGRISRDSIALAVRVRDISEERAIAAARRAEISRRDAEVRRATENAEDLGARLQESEARVKAADMTRAAIGEQLDRALREGADARAENRQLKSENQRLREGFDQVNRDLTEARATIAQLQSQNSSASARLTEIERADRERQQVEGRRRDFEAFRAAVATIVRIKPSGSGFIATLPDSFFVPNQASLALRVKAKVDELARVIAGHPDAAFTIEGHSDTRPNAEAFALGRAQAVAEYIGALGVSRTNFRVESRGAAVPISTARTLAAKASNRRVEIVFVGPQ
ncbi:MAG TPA: OmpA family protein [Blastocatellia bacterium]|nr:OmpA family protein [Blastocatellia bacterium]